MKQYPLDKTFIVSIWLEALVYGFFLCLFSASLYVNLTLRRFQDGHSKIMFVIGIIMWVIATMHLGMNCFRMIRGYVDHATTPGGAVAYIGNLATWDHIFKDTLYATQEIFGDAVAIYRCWIVWNHDWRVIVVPSILSIVSMISGYAVCGLYPSEHPDQTVFDPRLTHWISTFYAVAVVQSTLTTGCMAYKIWKTDRASAAFRAQESSLLPIVRILVESAALQLFVEILLVSLYAADYNAQYILLEIVTPLVGITFTAITIRIALRTSIKANQTHQNFTAVTTTARSVITDTQIPSARGHRSRPSITISVTKDVTKDNEDDDSVEVDLTEKPTDFMHSRYLHKPSTVSPV